MSLENRIAEVESRRRGRDLVYARFLVCRERDDADIVSAGGIVRQPGEDTHAFLERASLECARAGGPLVGFVEYRPKAASPCERRFAAQNMGTL